MKFTEIYVFSPSFSEITKIHVFYTLMNLTSESTNSVLNDARKHSPMVCAMGFMDRYQARSDTFKHELDDHPQSLVETARLYLSSEQEQARNLKFQFTNKNQARVKGFHDDFSVDLQTISCSCFVPKEYGWPF